VNEALVRLNWIQRNWIFTLNRQYWFDQLYQRVHIFAKRGNLVTFSLLNALAVALSNVLAGVSGRKVPVALVLALASPTALIVSVVAIFLEPAGWSPEGIGLGFVAGIVGGVGLLAAYRAFAIGPVGMIAAILASTATVVVALAGFALQGGGTWRTWLAVVACLIAIALVTVDSRPADIRLKALFLAVAGGVGSGAFVVVMNFTQPADGWSPFVAVRVAVVAVAIAFFAVSWKRLREVLQSGNGSRWWVFAVAAGFMDSLGNVSLILALRFLDLTTIAIVAAIIPAVTAVIGWTFLKEKLRLTQVLGIAVAAGAVALHALA
jgi:drug/metabolite transporter (DMT)-like permease